MTRISAALQVEPPAGAGRSPGIEGPEPLPRLRVTPAEFHALLEYSCSLPTGTTPGKRWKRLDGAYDRRCTRPRWMIGEYDPDCPPDATRIRIIWYRPIISLRAATASAVPANPKAAPPASRPSPAWTPERKAALVRLVKAGLSNAEILPRLNEYPAPRPIASRDSVKEMARSMGLQRTPEQREALRLAGSRLGGTNRHKDVLGGAPARTGRKRPLHWTAERDALCQRLWEAGDHADAIVAAANAAGGAAAINADQLRKRASTRGWQRSEDFRTARYARSIEAMRVANAAKRAAPAAMATATAPANAEEPSTRSESMKPAVAVARPLRTTPPEERSPEEQTRLADAAVADKQARAREKLRALIAAKRDSDFLQISAIAAHVRLPLSVVMRLLGEVRAAIAAEKASNGPSA